MRPNLSSSPSPDPSGSNQEKARVRKRKKLNPSTDENKQFSPIMNLDEILASSQVTPLHILVLFANNYEPFTDCDIDYVENKLLFLVRKEISKKRGQVLRYEKTQRTKNGWLLITCADEDTAKWTLKRTIPFFRGNSYRIIRATELPKTLAIEIVIPATGLDRASILKMIEQQNSGLKTSSWSVLNMRTSTNSDGEIVVMNAKIPIIQLPTLRKLQWRPYFEFSRACITKCELGPEKKKSVKKTKPFVHESNFNDAGFVRDYRRGPEVRKSPSPVTEREFDYRKVYSIGRNTKSLVRDLGPVVAEVVLDDSDDGRDEPENSSSKNETCDTSLADNSANDKNSDENPVKDVLSVSDDELKKDEKEATSTKEKLMTEVSSSKLLSDVSSSDLEVTLSDSDENENSELCKALRQSIRKDKGKSPIPEPPVVEIILSDSDNEFSGDKDEEPGGDRSSPTNIEPAETSSDVDVIEIEPTRHIICISDEDNQSDDDLKESDTSQSFPGRTAATKRPLSDSSDGKRRKMMKTGKAGVSPKGADGEDEDLDNVLMMEGEAFYVVSETDEESNHSLGSDAEDKLLLMEGEAFIIVSEASQESSAEKLPTTNMESGIAAEAQEVDDPASNLLMKEPVEDVSSEASTKNVASDGVGEAQESDNTSHAHISSEESGKSHKLPEETDGVCGSSEKDGNACESMNFEGSIENSNSNALEPATEKTIGEEERMEIEEGLTSSENVSGEKSGSLDTRIEDSLEDNGTKEALEKHPQTNIKTGKVDEFEEMHDLITNVLTEKPDEDQSSEKHPQTNMETGKVDEFEEMDDLLTKVLTEKPNEDPSCGHQLSMETDPVESPGENVIEKKSGSLADVRTEGNAEVQAEPVPEKTKERHPKINMESGKFGEFEGMEDLLSKVLTENLSSGHQLSMETDPAEAPSENFIEKKSGSLADVRTEGNAEKECLKAEPVPEITKGHQLSMETDQDDPPSEKVTEKKSESLQDKKIEDNVQKENLPPEPVPEESKGHQLSMETAQDDPPSENVTEKKSESLQDKKIEDNVQKENLPPEPVPEESKEMSRKEVENGTVGESQESDNTSHDHPVSEESETSLFNPQSSAQERIEENESTKSAN